MSIKQALEECKRRFPIGTKYISIVGSQDNIKDTTTIQLSNDGNYIVAYTKYGSNRILWESNRFAKIEGFIEAYYEIY